MKVLSGLVGIGAVVAAALPLSSKAVAEDLGGQWKSITYSSPALATGPWIAVGGVLYSGEIEAGGLGFIDRPQNQIRTTTTLAAPPNPLTPAFFSSLQHQNESRAKFEEYGNIRPGFWFDHLTFGAATPDGRYFTDLSATHIGNNDQNYFLQWGETGKQYLTLQWDQIPHLYSTTAQSIFGGSPTFLTVPTGLNGLSGPGALAPQCITAFNAANCSAQINSRLQTIDLGIRRDKGTAEYRSTPTENSEFNVEYSHERRTGTQETGVIISGSPGGPGVQVPMPIADTTQDARASWQYHGTSFWGQKFNFNVQYAASIYQNDNSSFSIQNPFFDAAPNPTIARYSLLPDNTAQSLTATLGADLPSKSRYMGTFSYTMMRQNDPFMAQTSNTSGVNLACGNAAGCTPALPGAINAGVPRGSLNGAIDTLLWNNVLTTQINPDLKSKLSYRYYSVDNKTPPLTLNNFVIGDTTIAAAQQSYAPHVTQFSSYVRQNAGWDMTHHPASWVTTGFSLGWERYQRDQANVNVTNEYIGKIFADFKPMDPITVRTSYQSSWRKYDNYDYTRYVWAQITGQALGGFFNACTPGVNCGANIGGLQINDAMRIYNLANRERQKANLYIDVDAGKGLVLTPTFGLRYDKYPQDAVMTITQTTLTGAGCGAGGGPCTLNFIPTTASGANQLGLNKEYSLNSGLDASYKLNASTTLMASYMHENLERVMLFSTGVGSNPGGVSSGFPNHSKIKVNDFVDTVTAAVNFELKPKAVDLRFGYTYVHATETGKGVSCIAPVAAGGPILGTCDPANATIVNANVQPNTTSNFQRFESTLKYTFDETTMRQFGPSLQGYLKLRYAYEQYRVDNWQDNIMMPYMVAVTTGTGANSKLWMAGNNPNYNAQLLMATLGFNW